jgi:hypothetical protein
LFAPAESVTFGQLSEILLSFAWYQDLRVSNAELISMISSANVFPGLSASDEINRAQASTIIQIFAENAR